jgi:hypothetical protein
MSDPRYTDPRLTEPPRDDMRDEMRREQRMGELEQSNAMWGWIAGGVVLALLLVFIFGRGPNTSDTAQQQASPPATTTGQSTGMAPRGPAPSADTAQRPAPAPSTTGQRSQ